MREPRMVVVLPCRDEQATIAEVVADFRAALPAARCCVYDNASTDKTAAVARAAGADVYTEPEAGKGNVVRRMFADIDADIYVLADGDGQHDAAAAPAMVERLVADNLDMVVGVRVADPRQGESRPYARGHVFGNALLNWLISAFFGGDMSDVSSGYRVMSRRLVKSFPAISRNFEIELELAAHCVTLRLPWAEVPVRHFVRPPGSSSKLRTFRDGGRALLAIGLLVKEIRPLRFFGIAGLLLAALSLTLAVPVVETYMATDLVPQLPTAVLCVGLMLTAGGSVLAGLILDAVSRGRREQKMIAYLRYQSIQQTLTGPS